MKTESQWRKDVRSFLALLSLNNGRMDRNRKHVVRELTECLDTDDEQRARTLLIF